MKPILAFLVSQTILFPIIIGCIRFKSIKTNYQPFFWDLVCGLATEIVSFILIHGYHAHNAVPTNIFVLLEWVLLAYQFHTWGFLKKQKRIFRLLVAIPVLVWIIENIVFWKIGEFSPYFRVLYAFLIALMAITEINYKITHDNINLFKNPPFIICVGLILFFVYQMLYEWSYQMSIAHESSQITGVINALFAYINAITNIIFGLGFLSIPVRRQFKLE
ncbi:MAG TPA: hypothetical protein VMI35_09765 [Puia sp.]|nr:hypothetical protein [Puia sp.]